MSTYRILLGDCRETLRTLPDASVQCCVTSPPYWGLRDYGHDGQLGLEPTPEEYVANMVEVFREVRRVLRDDGTLWLNLGDSYARAPEKGGSGPGGKNGAYLGNAYGVAQSAKVGSSDGAVGRAERPGTRAASPDLKPKDLVGIPWRVAFALQADGWYLRSDIIWAKPNGMPESVTDRPTKAHEYLFLLAKSERYYYDADAISEESVSGPYVRQRSSTFKKAGSQDDRFGGHDKGAPLVISDGTRNARSVWTIATQSFRGAHFAVFPPELAERCILAGSKPGDVVLDPFGGSGTTGMVATGHGRRAILCELNPAYADLMRERCGPMLESA